MVGNRTLVCHKRCFRAGLSENPPQALIDSQSVKTTGAVEQNGFDMGKTKGVKRQIAICLSYFEENL